MADSAPIEMLDKYLERIDENGPNDSLECMKVYMLYYLYSNNEETIQKIRKQISEANSAKYEIGNGVAHARNVARLHRELNLRQHMLRGFLKRELEM